MANAPVATNRHEAMLLLTGLHVQPRSPSPSRSLRPMTKDSIACVRLGKHDNTKGAILVGTHPMIELIQRVQDLMAETEGFEPSVPLIAVRRFSKPLVSATHPRLRTGGRRRL